MYDRLIPDAMLLNSARLGPLLDDETLERMASSDIDSAVKSPAGLFFQQIRRKGETLGTSQHKFRGEFRYYAEQFIYEYVSLMADQGPIPDVTAEEFRTALKKDEIFLFYYMRDEYLFRRHQNDFLNDIRRFVLFSHIAEADEKGKQYLKDTMAGFLKKNTQRKRLTLLLRASQKRPFRSKTAALSTRRNERRR